MHRIRRAALAVALSLLLLAPAALAAGKPAERHVNHKPEVLQRIHLIAMPGTVQRWASIPTHGVADVEVFQNGHALDRHWFGNCQVNYTGRSVFVTVRVEPCHTSANTDAPFVLKYVSTSGTHMLAVRVVKYN
jgi:hypothetical protein